MKILLLFVLSACASKQATTPSSRLFPYGTYEQRVELERDGKHHQFPAKVEWSKELFTLDVTEVSGQPLIEYDEKFRPLKKTVKLNTEKVPLSEEKALFYFSYLKFLYSLDRSICQQDKCQWDFMGARYDFTLNSDGSVQKFQMTRGDKTMTVKVEKFRPL